MLSVKVKNDRGDILSFDNSRDYIVYKVEGLNPPQATINTSANTTADGSKINSARLENRNIVIYISIERDIEKNRLNLYKYFPVKKNVTLYFRNGSRNVHICGAVEVIECDLFAQKQVAQISIICPQPYFKAIDEVTTSFSDITPLFSFPFSIPKSGIEFSAITPNVHRSIINAGEVETGAIITLYANGEVVNPVIYNVQRKTQFKLNITMQAQDTIIINTNIGEKAITLIRSGESINAMGYMARDSEWFNLEAGDNVFTYTCDSGSSNLQITFTTPLLYSGV